MAEKLYLVSSPWMTAVKIGCWNGSVRDLLNRYKTPYGKVEAIVFACDDRRILEACAHGYLSKFRLAGEVFKKEATDEFIWFCQQCCHDSVPNERLLDAQAAKLQRQKERLKKRNDKLRRKRLSEEQDDHTLGNFIKEHCIVEKYVCVSTTALREAFNACCDVILDAKKLKTKMEARGFSCKDSRINGFIVKAFHGLRLV
jgi:hypothetical protein